MGGGSGRRFGRPKQYESVGNERVVDRSRRVAESVSDGVVLVVPPEDVDREGGVAGGSTRAESVRAGLAAVPADADVICVHDAARPMASPDLYRAVVAAVVAGADGAVPGVPVVDTIKIVVGADRVVSSTPDRGSLVAVQTPQAFAADILRRAHAAGADGTDDASLVEAIGGRVVVVPGEVGNRKITEPADLDHVRSAIMDGDAGGGGEPE